MVVTNVGSFYTHRREEGNGPCQEAYALRLQSQRLQVTPQLMSEPEGTAGIFQSPPKGHEEGCRVQVTVCL